MKVSNSCQDSCFKGKYWLSFFAGSMKSAILTSSWFYYRSLMFVWQNIDDLSNVREPQDGWYITCWARTPAALTWFKEHCVEDIIAHVVIINSGTVLVDNIMFYCKIHQAIIMQVSNEYTERERRSTLRWWTTT